MNGIPRVACGVSRTCGKKSSDVAYSCRIRKCRERAPDIARRIAGAVASIPSRMIRAVNDSGTTSRSSEASRAISSGSLSLGWIPCIVRDRREAEDRRVQDGDVQSPAWDVRLRIVDVAAEVVEPLDLGRLAGRLARAEVEARRQVVRRRGLVVQLH